MVATRFQSPLPLDILSLIKETNMSSIDIYSILSSKPHNPHYLKRYYKFILWCQQINSTKTKEELGKISKHHICPKAKDLFPEYESFKKFSWNKAILTGRQHFIAHHILWKTYFGSQIDAFWMMSGKYKLSSRQYEKLRFEHSNNMREFQLNMSANGIHSFQNKKFIEEHKIRNKNRDRSNVIYTDEGNNIRICATKKYYETHADTHYWKSKDHSVKTSNRIKKLCSENKGPSQSKNFTILSQKE